MGMFDEFSGMKAGQRWALIGFACLGALPIMTIVGVQAKESLGTTLVAEAAAPSASAMLETRIEPYGLATPDNRMALNLLANHAAMNDERRVILSLDIPLDDMRAGAARTQKPLAQRVTEAIAATKDIAENECKRLVSVFASGCRVLSADGRQIDDRHFEYRIQLAFVEKAGLGKISPDGALVFGLDKRGIGGPEIGGRVGMARAGDLRSKIYATIARHCAEIRKTKSLCSVTAISLSSRLVADLPMVTVSTSASFATVTRAKNDAGQS